MKTNNHLAMNFETLLSRNASVQRAMERYREFEAQIASDDLDMPQMNALLHAWIRDKGLDPDGLDADLIWECKMHCMLAVGTPQHSSH